MGKIILPHQSLNFEEIIAGSWVESDPYYKDALLFCQDWLGGKRSFDLNTSGSTGAPKKVSILKVQMEISAKATRDFFHIPPQPRLLCCLHADKIAGKMMLVRGMQWDGEIHLVKPTADPFMQYDLPRAFDFVGMVPLQVDKCLQNPNSIERLLKIKTILIGGAALSRTLYEKIKAEKLNAFQSFGMTETVSHFALAKIEGERPIYQPLPGVKIGTDASGKLWVKAPMANDDLLQTNDLVDISERGSFVWKGRADFTINSGGIKIQPEILESQIQSEVEQAFGPLQFFVFGKKDEALGEKVVLVIESKLSGDVHTDGFLDMLTQGLPKYHTPKEILFVADFEMTPSGKIDRPKTIKKMP